MWTFTLLTSRFMESRAGIEVQGRRTDKNNPWYYQLSPLWTTDSDNEGVRNGGSRLYFPGVIVPTLKMEIRVPFRGLW